MNHSLQFKSILLLLLLLGCGPKVMVPPRIDLASYDGIGMIEVTANVKGSLREFATQEFLLAIQSSQPNIAILELGDQNEVLRTINRDRLDPDAIKALGEKHSIDILLTGKLDVTDIKPKVELFDPSTYMSVRAEVEAAFIARIFETSNGATLWTNSAKNKGTVAHVTLTGGEFAHFDAKDPDEAYGDLIGKIMENVTKDFRVRYVRK